MEFPFVPPQYLLALEELQREMPSMHLWQLDGILRSRQVPMAPSVAPLFHFGFSHVSPVSVPSAPVASVTVPSAAPVAPAPAAPKVETKLRPEATFFEPRKTQPAWSNKPWLSMKEDDVFRMRSKPKEDPSPSRLSASGSRRGRE